MKTASTPSAAISNLTRDPGYVRPQIDHPPFEGRALRIEALLVSYRDLIEAATPSSPSDGTYVPLIPHAKDCGVHRLLPPLCTCHQRSVQELERLLVMMRAERRSQWWHLTERYLRSVQATKDMPVKRKDRHGKTFLDTERQLVYVVSPAVRLEKVRRGMGWLADAWSMPFEPMLPQEILVAA